MNPKGIMNPRSKINQEKIIVLGVIGETGSGKTTFSKYLEEMYKSYLIHGDDVGHQLLKTKEIIDSLVERYTGNILDLEAFNKGEYIIDRSKLGDIVFNDSEQLSYLNSLMHPRIYTWIKDEIHRIKNSFTNKDYTFIVVDGAALIEANITKLCDAVIYIFADKEVRLQRLIQKRNISTQKALAMIEAQQKSDYFLKEAHYIIDLNTDIHLDKKRKTIDATINKLLQELL